MKRKGAKMQDSAYWAVQTQLIYDKVRLERKPYKIEVAGLNLIVLPDVFSPKYFTDSEYFAQELPMIVGQGSFLEIGVGTGIVAISCGARVGTDINPGAVLNAQINGALNEVNTDFRFGDLFDPIAPEEKFDFIFWNHPFNKANEPVGDILLRAGFDYEYRDLKRYIREGQNHLNPGGKLLLGTGGFAPLDEIENYARKDGYQVEVLRRKTFPIEEGSDVALQYLIYEFSQL